jgi:hypothetical protein
MNAEILGKLFFSKNYFLYGEKENLEEYSWNMALAEMGSSKNNNNLVAK